MRTHTERVVLGVLEPFYLGQQAVTLFFVLSGFVLALPYLSGRQPSYPKFLARRYLRLYGPYLVALGLAVAGASRWHGHHGMGVWADNVWSEPIDWKLVLAHVLFLGNYNWNEYNVVFWSLVFEMRISIIFPLLVALITRVRLRVAFLLAVACPLVYRGLVHFRPKAEDTMETVSYVAVFIFGILLAKYRAAIAAWYAGRSGGQRALVVAGTAIFYSCSHFLSHLGQVGTLVGAIGFIVIAQNSEVARGFLNGKIPVFLGRISYSLYLVHVPLLFALVSLWHTKISRGAMFFLYVGGALLLGSVFNVLVEEPFIRLSHKFGRGNATSEDVVVPAAV